MVVGLKLAIQGAGRVIFKPFKLKYMYGPEDEEDDDVAVLDDEAMDEEDIDTGAMLGDVNDSD